MPPITGNQGSRTGLITSVVIFTVLFVVATIFAIYYAVQAQTAREDLATFRSTVVPKYLPTGVETGGAPAPELEAARNKGENGLTVNMPLMTVALTLDGNVLAWGSNQRAQLGHLPTTGEAKCTAPCTELPQNVTMP